jgi:acyl-CoA synthetase (AMP-forming)/AMP-acid ligase II
MAPGQTVALALPDGPEAAVAFLSLAAAGLTAAPLNPAHRPAEFQRYLSAMRPAAVAVPADVDSAARAAARRLSLPVLEVAALRLEPAALFRPPDRPPARPAGAPPPHPEDPLALLLHTSGTTADPKLVALTQSSLCRAARTVADSLALAPADRGLAVMPLFHIHGLVAGLLAPLASGGSVVCTPGFLAPRFLPWLRELQPTWYTAVPSVHHAILARARAHPGEAAGSRLRVARSCSAPLPPRVMAELEATLGVPVIEAYGMTEAAHQVTSNPIPPGRRKPGSVGVPTNAEVVVMDQTGEALPPGHVGEVAVRGPSVIRGYQGRDAAQGSFQDGWFRTGDRGRLDEDGYLFLTGRLKEVINRGGVKIAPREIEEALLEHPAVLEAAAFGVPDARLGERVAAAAVLGAPAASDERELRRFAEARLADFKVPERILLVDALPRGATGKLDRARLAERWAAGPAPEAAAHPPGVPPRTPYEGVLAAIWEAVLERPHVGVHDDFLELGGDSLLAARVLSRVRDELGVDVSPLDFFEQPTIAGQATVVLEARARQLSPERLAGLLAGLSTGEAPGAAAGRHRGEGDPATPRGEGSR